MKFTSAFGLKLSQAEVDFVDVDLLTDTPLYLCPYAIQIRNDDWSEECGDLIRSFFTSVLDELRANNSQRVNHLLGHLHEPNETRLGQSDGAPRGRGVGADKSFLIGEALRNSQAYQSGLLQDISDAELFIFGVGRDTISDLTTNIIRGKLAKYTEDQCVLHGIQTKPVRSIGPAWDAARQDWVAGIYNLPVFNGRPILLVPKSCVRRRLSLDSQEFYNHYMIEFLQEEYLRAGSALVQTLKNGNQRVTKKSVKQRHPFDKDDFAAFCQKHPDILAAYKKMAGAKGPLELGDFDDAINETILAAALIERLKSIPTGAAHASEYHQVSVAICTFLFYPELSTPIKEYEQHNGRKRVDIKFTNAATEGFFFRLLHMPQTRAHAIFVECKNYTRDVANPELDQLSGRFNLRQGFFGMLLCRTLDDRNKTMESCRDTAKDGRGFMLPLDDSDLIQLLENAQHGKRHLIEKSLDELFDRLVR